MEFGPLQNKVVKSEEHRCAREQPEYVWYIVNVPMLRRYVRGLDS